MEVDHVRQMNLLREENVRLKQLVAELTLDKTMLQDVLQKDAPRTTVAELRLFGGLTTEETAEFLGVSPATVSRDWSSGKLWLARELHNATASRAAVTSVKA